MVFLPVLLVVSSSRRSFCPNGSCVKIIRTTQQKGYYNYDPKRMNRSSSSSSISSSHKCQGLLEHYYYYNEQQQQQQQQNHSGGLLSSKDAVVLSSTSIVPSFNRIIGGNSSKYNNYHDSKKNQPRTTIITNNTGTTTNSIIRTFSSSSSSSNDPKTTVEDGTATNTTISSSSSSLQQSSSALVSLSSSLYNCVLFQFHSTNLGLLHMRASNSPSNSNSSNHSNHDYFLNETIIQSIRQLPEMDMVFNTTTATLASTSSKTTSNTSSTTITTTTFDKLQSMLERSINIFKSIQKGSPEHLAVLVLFIECQVRNGLYHDAYQSLLELESYVCTKTTNTNTDFMNNTTTTVREQMIKIAKAKVLWYMGYFQDSLDLCMESHSEISNPPITPYTAPTRNGQGLARLLLIPPTNINSKQLLETIPVRVVPDNYHNENENNEYDEYEYDEEDIIEEHQQKILDVLFVVRDPFRQTIIAFERMGINVMNVEEQIKYIQQQQDSSNRKKKKKKLTTTTTITPSSSSQQSSMNEQDEQQQQQQHEQNEQQQKQKQQKHEHYMKTVLSGFGLATSYLNMGIAELVYAETLSDIRSLHLHTEIPLSYMMNNLYASKSILDTIVPPPPSSSIKKKRKKSTDTEDDVSSTNEVPLEQRTTNLPPYYFALYCYLYANVTANLAYGFLQMIQTNQHEQFRMLRTDNDALIQQAMDYATKSLSMYEQKWDPTTNKMKTKDSPSQQQQQQQHDGDNIIHYVLSRDDGYNRSLAILADCYVHSGNAVTAEGLYRSALSASSSVVTAATTTTTTNAVSADTTTGANSSSKRNTILRIPPSHVVHTRYTYESYAKLCAQWDQRDNESKQLQQMSQTIQDAINTALDNSNTSTSTTSNNDKMDPTGMPMVTTTTTTSSSAKPTWGNKSLAHGSLYFWSPTLLSP